MPANFLMKKRIPPSHSPYDCSFAVCSCRAIRKASNSLETSRALCQEYWSSIGVRGTLHAKRTMYKTLKVEITNPDEISKSLKNITWSAAHTRLGHIRECYSPPSPLVIVRLCNLKVLLSSLNSKDFVPNRWTVFGEKTADQFCSPALVQ